MFSYNTKGLNTTFEIFVMLVAGGRVATTVSIGGSDLPQCDLEVGQDVRGVACRW